MLSPVDWEFCSVFIDADKRNYRFYLQSILGEPAPFTNEEGVEQVKEPARCLLNPGAIIMVDNTLWKGLVLSKVSWDDIRVIMGRDCFAVQTEDLSEYAPRPQEYGDKGRMVKMTDWIHQFNVFVAEHPQLEVVLVPMRDGLTLIRYKGTRE